MKKQVLIIVGVALASFLGGTMFSTSYFASGKPPSVWDVINDLQTQVNALTATVNEQQARISELQTQVDILSATKLARALTQFPLVVTYLEQQEKEDLIDERYWLISEVPQEN